MTKTQKQLIDKAQNGKVVVSLVTGQGAEGGMIHEGSRAFKAAAALAARGLLRQVRKETAEVNKNGYTLSSIDVTYTA